MRRRHLDGVHALRGIAALAIVVYHAGRSVGSDSYQGAAAANRAVLGLSAGVDLFFVISGFVIALPWMLGERPRIGGYLLQRALRIYPMAILTALLFMGTAFLLYRRVPSADLMLSSLLLLPSATVPLPGVLWTLKQELLFYGLFALAYLDRRRGMALVLAWALVSPVMPPLGVVGDWLFHAQNVQFAFGIAAAWGFAHLRLPGAPARVLALAGLAGFGLVASLGRMAGLAFAAEVVLLGALGAISVLGAASGRGAWPAVLLGLGTVSYSLYLIHFYFISFGNKVLTTLAPSLPWAAALVLLAAFATVGGAAYHALFERRLEAWRKARPRGTVAR